ncbi:MFS transporter [Demequina zhanjiangensis]|uniref:MFS transporter n=1 Tax=Demequina zhanjiangensis TaxID=3051659 RepID=A0ABT8G1H9_9MICO|nr:MFS transporter [Demequina sp. SYSU T00b26]MDN4472986.1 MFS transporter [Demequina sp. SYSU T00b26]
MTTKAENETPSLWRNRSFTTLLTGEAISHAGVQIATLALPITAVNYLGADERESGLVLAAATSAFLLIGLPAGAWVDRMRKRPVMMTANLVRAALMAMIPALYMTGHLTIAWLIGIAFALGFATVFFDVAYLSVVPSLVRKEHLGQANANLETVGIVARVAGPGAAGLLTRILEAPNLLGAGAIGYLASAFAVSRIKAEEQRGEKSAGGLWSEVREGTSFVFRHPLLSRTTLSAAAVGLFDNLARALMAILILREMGVSETAYGMLFTLAALASLGGARLAPWLQSRFGSGKVIVWGFGVAALTTAAYPLALILPPTAGYLTLLASMLLGFGGITVFNIAHVTMRQQLCPPRMLGRMTATMRFAMWGVMPIGSLLGGELGSRLGLGPAFLIALVGSILGWLIVALSPVRRVRSADEWLARQDHPSTWARERVESSRIKEVKPGEQSLEATSVDVDGQVPR